MACTWVWCKAGCAMCCSIISVFGIMFLVSFLLIYFSFIFRFKFSRKKKTFDYNFLPFIHDLNPRRSESI